MNKRNLSILKSKWKIHIQNKNSYLYARLIPTEILYCYETNLDFKINFNSSISLIKEKIQEGKMDYVMSCYIHNIRNKTKACEIFDKAYFNFNKEVKYVLEGKRFWEY